MRSLSIEDVLLLVDMNTNSDGEDVTAAQKDRIPRNPNPNPNFDSILKGQISERDEGNLEIQD